MSSTAVDYDEALEDLRLHEDDTGSAVAQIIRLSERIDELTAHLKDHPQDHSCRRGLRKLIGKRDDQLEYLRDRNYDRYADVVERLDL